MFHQYQQMAVFLTVQSLGIGLLMLPKLHTILDPARKQKTIMTSKTVKVKYTLNSIIPEEQISSFISGLGKHKLCSCTYMHTTDD